MAKKKEKRAKHIPQRTCVGCREVNAKRKLIRLVRTPEGIQIDPSGKQPGRGAYLHEDRSCWEKGIKGSLSRALKTEVTEEDLNMLQAYLENIAEDDSSL
jgi:predicted RNA-binding protein YlxR (DUF448 family)